MTARMINSPSKSVITIRRGGALPHGPVALPIEVAFGTCMFPSPCELGNHVYDPLSMQGPVQTAVPGSMQFDGVARVQTPESARFYACHLPTPVIAGTNHTSVFRPAFLMETSSHGRCYEVNMILPIGIIVSGNVWTGDWSSTCGENPSACCGNNEKLPSFDLAGFDSRSRSPLGRGCGG